LIPPRWGEDQPCPSHLQHFALGLRGVPFCHCKIMKAEKGELGCSQEEASNGGGQNERYGHFLPDPAPSIT
jgi:hypothetical protein